MNYSSKQHYLGNGSAHEGAAKRGVEEAVGSSRAASLSHLSQVTGLAQSDGQSMGRLSLDEQTDKDSFVGQCGARPHLVQPASAESTFIMGDELSGKEFRNQEQFDPHAVWQMLLSELALQMPSATFNTWVRDTWVVAYEDGEFIIGLPNAYARDWLENRLRNKIKRALSSFIYRSVQVQFLVRPRTVSDAVDAKPVPLYATASVGTAPINDFAPPSMGAAKNPQVMTATDINSDAVAMKSRRDRIDSLQVDAAQVVPQEFPPHNSTGGSEEQEHHGHEYGTPPSPSERDSLPSARQEVKSVPAATNNEQQSLGRLGQEWTNPDRRTDYYADNMPPIGKIPLNGQYTFETFVVGSHNKLAHAAAEAITEKPGQSFNPLFVYGGVGLGKTHLLHSIGHRAKQLGHHMLYVSSEQFTNELIGAIRSQSTEDFRNKYRQVDILLIDDIQFISGKESTQEEFFHTFNHLHSSGRQVVLSSDRPPKMLATLDDRLRSRFEGGLQTDIAQPDFETRVAILQSKANRMAAAVDHSVLMMVAERVDSNIRELEGALNRLIVQARLMQSPLTLQLATSILDNLAPERTVCAPDKLLRIVAEHFQLTAADLCGRKRTKLVAGARQIAMYFLREEHALSLPAIGTLLGGRDHSTVRYGIEKVNEDLAEDETLRQTISALREKMYLPI